MKLSRPQRDLLNLLQSREVRGITPMAVRGNQLRVAQALQRRGLATLAIDGSGQAFVDRWWYAVTLTEKGRST